MSSDDELLAEVWTKLVADFGYPRSEPSRTRLWPPPGRNSSSYQGLLAELLLAECDDRDRRSSSRRVKAANFPTDKWLGDFDFDANPTINPATVHTLATGDWIRKGQPLC